jgi:hypothetical protein
MSTKYFTRSLTKKKLPSATKVLLTYVVLSTESSPLLFELSKLNSQQSKRLQNEHALWGFKELSFLGDDSKQSTLQVQKNILFLDEFSRLNQEFLRQAQSPVTPLKGLSLLQGIYSKTLARPMTDMDIYTQLPKDVFTKILTSLGYEFVAEKKWRFNQHKFLFKKHHSLAEIICEVHTDLVPRSSVYPWTISELGALTHDDEFLFLCYHWAEQHTCLKLFWLFDLLFYIQKYPLDPEILWAKAKRLKITSSLLAAHWALQNCFQVTLLQKVPASHGWKSFLLKKILTPSTLTHIHDRRGIYLLLKHLLKDQLSTQLVYTWLWLRHKYF